MALVQHKRYISNFKKQSSLKNLIIAEYFISNFSIKFSGDGTAKINRKSIV